MGLQLISQDENGLSAWLQVSWDSHTQISSLLCSDYTWVKQTGSKAICSSEDCGTSL